jgi:hypothetical protein
VRLLALALLLAQPVPAQEAMDGQKFETLVEGRSLAWAHPGQEPYGLERYFPGPRVLWLRTETRECMEGKWWEQEDGAPGDLLRLRGRPPAPLLEHPDQGRQPVATPDWGGPAIRTRLGPEHETPFGCGFLGSRERLPCSGGGLGGASLGAGTLADGVAAVGELDLEAVGAGGGLGGGDDGAVAADHGEATGQGVA